MAKRIRVEATVLSQHLKKVTKGIVRTDLDTQRYAGAFTNNMINELIVTVLNDDYIPPIILAEETLPNGKQTWVVDGLQRTSSLAAFRTGAFKTTRSIENPFIEYEKNVLDENGNPMRDEDGNYITETMQFDLRNKYFEDLPQELKDRFDDYQLSCAVHYNCTIEEILRLVKRYNNHVAMSTRQTAFTCLPAYARQIKEVAGNKFYKDGGTFSNKEIVKSVREIVIMETAMLSYHFNDWKKNIKQIAEYLNDNATYAEFETIDEAMTRLTNIISDDDSLRKLFNAKDSFIFISLFIKFMKSNKEDRCFAQFLRKFVNSNDEAWNKINSKRNTKDKSTVSAKMDYLINCMNNELGLTEIADEYEQMKFITENVGVETNEEDMELYTGMLDDLMISVDNSSCLLDKENRKSLLGVIAYSVQNDLDIDDWFINWFEEHTDYNKDQKQNYKEMVTSLAA